MAKLYAINEPGTKVAIQHVLARSKRPWFFEEEHLRKMESLVLTCLYSRFGIASPDVQTDWKVSIKTNSSGAVWLFDTPYGYMEVVYVFNT